MFGWLLALSPQTVQRLLSSLMASALNDITGTDGVRPMKGSLARAFGPDMTRWWSATGEAYLQHVSEARVVEVLREAAGPLAALKKDAAVAQAEQLRVGRGSLPGCLRTQPAADPSEGEAGDTHSMAGIEAPACN